MSTSAVPSLNFDLQIDNFDGQTLFFKDTTTNYGVGSNINYSDIKAVRFLASTYDGLQNPSSLKAGDTLNQYQQYIKTSVATSTYDGKSITLGDYFIPFVSGLTVLVGDTFDTTGVTTFFPPNYLPTNAQNILNIFTSWYGISDSVFDNTVYGLQYEIYIDTNPDPISAVTANKQYIVTGTVGVVTYNGNTYRIGEVFIASDSGAITFGGDTNVKVLIASVNKYFTFIWPLKTRLFQLIVNKDCACDMYFNKTYDQIMLDIYGLDNANYANWTSAAHALTIINRVNDKINLLETL